MHTRMFLRAAFVAALLFLSTACMTGYQRSGFISTGGYSEERIDDATYRVSFDGNGNTSEEKVWYFWLYRCAELTKMKGYQGFGVRADNPGTAAIGPRTGVRPASFDPNHSGGQLLKVKGGGGYRAPTYIYTPGSTITSWHKKAIVSMYHLPVIVSLTEVFSADSVLRDLHDYVISDGKSAPPSRNEVLIHAVAFVPSAAKPPVSRAQIFKPLAIPKLGGSGPISPNGH